MSFIFILATVVITSCNFSTEQKAATLEKAKSIVAEASQAFYVALEDSVEYANYKIASEIKLKANELLIADMKDKLKLEHKESTIEYGKQLNSFNTQNSQLRNNMLMYSSEGKDNWELFKRRFNRDLDALGKSILQLASEI